MFYKHHPSLLVIMCLNSVRMGFLFLLVLGIDCVILLLHSLDIPYNYFSARQSIQNNKGNI